MVTAAVDHGTHGNGCADTEENRSDSRGFDEIARNENYIRKSFGGVRCRAWMDE